jgi:hypothetical protein
MLMQRRSALPAVIHRNTPAASKQLSNGCLSCFQACWL